MEDCIFCKILRKEIPSKAAYEDEHVYAFHDINPAAPVHILIIPKKHIASVNDINEENAATAGHIMVAAAKLAAQLGLDKAGYRIVANCGESAGQTVFHLHFHLLGGRDFTWPPG